MSGAVKQHENELQYTEGFDKAEFGDGVFYFNKQQRESTRINST